MDPVWFTPEDQDTLCLTPFWVLSSLSGRHGRLEPVELGVLVQCVELAGVAPGELVAQVLTVVQNDVERLAARFEHDPRTVSTGLMDVAVVLRQVPRSEAQLFKRMLVGDLGVLLATALGPFGRTAKVEDLLRLQLLPALLEDPDVRPFHTRAVG